MIGKTERQVVVGMRNLAANAKTSTESAGTIIDRVSVTLQRTMAPEGEITDATRAILRQRAAGLQAEIANIQALIDGIEEF